MRIIILISIYISSVQFACAQEKKETTSDYNFSINYGIGLTIFDISGFETDSYPALLTRIGVGVSRNVTQRIMIESGIRLNFRAKSKSPLKDGIFWHGNGLLLLTLDETATQRHFALEFPIYVHYILDANRSINTGIIIRRWGPKDQTPVSYFASQTEIGCALGLTQRIFNRFSIGLDLFIGLKDFYPGGVVGNAGDISVKNRSAMFSLSYAL